MQFLLLICLMIVCLPIKWPNPLGIGAGGSACYTGATCLFLLLLAGMIAQRTSSKLVNHSESRDKIAQRYSAARTQFFFVNLGAFAFSLVILGWGKTVVQLAHVEVNGKEELVPGGELLILVPYLFTQIGSWFLFYDADREFHRLISDSVQRGRFWSRSGYVLFIFRQQLILIFAPLFLLMVQQGVERMYPEIAKSRSLPYLSLLVLPAFLVFFPLVLPTMLGLQRLPSGHIRNRFEANARRLRFRYSRLYLWDTRHAVANAMIVGVVPWIRFVIFTDRLIDDLGDDEIDAVFGHEIGHAKHGHMLYYGLFLVFSFILMGSLAQAVRLVDEEVLQEYETLFLIAPVIAMGVYMFAAFGFISRRCERQADIFGCRAVSCNTHFCDLHGLGTIYPEEGKGLCRTGVDSFIRALRRVEEINGLNREKPHGSGTGLRGKLSWIFRQLTGWLHTWQHSTIPKRIAFLEKIAEDPVVERRFQDRLWITKWVVMLAILGALFGLGLWKGWEILLVTV
jgi:Zn-dependent protease with chaperone function